MAEPDDVKTCERHPGEKILAACGVCGRGICRVCRQKQGYFCSEECKRTAFGQREQLTEQEAARDRNLDRIRTGVSRWFRIVTRIVIPAAAVLLVLVVILNTRFSGGGLKWEFKAPGDKPFSEIALSDDAVLVGCGDGNLYALDRETGAVRWSFRADESLADCRPSLTGSGICVVWGASALYGIDCSNGALAWKAPIEGCMESGPVPGGEAMFFVTGIYEELSPEEAKKRLIFGWIPGGPLPQGDAHPPGVRTGCRLHALDCSDGRERWSKDLDGSAVDHVSVAGAALYYVRRQFKETEYTQSLVAREAATGTGKWEAVLSGGRLVATHPCPEGILLVSAAGLYLISHDGKTVWEQKRQQAGLWGPIVADDGIYAREGDDLLACLDLKTGTKVWDAKVQSLMSMPVAAQDLVFLTGFKEVKLEEGERRQIKPPSPIGRRSGAKEVLDQFAGQMASDTKVVPAVYALDRGTGRERWTQSNVGGQLLYTDGKLIAIRSSSMLRLVQQEIAEYNRITALDAAGGKKLWNRSHDGVVTSHAAGGGMLFLVSHSGSHAFGSGMGALMSGSKPVRTDNAVSAMGM